MSIKTIMTFGVILVMCVALMVYLLLSNCRDEVATAQLRENESQQMDRTRKLARLYEKLGSVPCYIPTIAESNELTVAFGRVSSAYMNGDPAALSVAVQKVPCLATNVSVSVLNDLCDPFYTHYRNSFLMRHEMRSFDTVEDFDTFARLNVEMALFLGRMEVGRGAYSGFLMQIDRNVLSRLRQYEGRFNQAGNAALARSAEKFIEAWQLQIESKDGFTRSYMWHQARLQLVCVYECGMTEEQMLRFVRGRANGLIKAGYTPKWLDEFTIERIRAESDR